MSNQKSMELGLNQNIKYKGVVYHIQSEDGGKQNPVLTTHLFKGGVILSTRRDNYDPSLPGDELTGAIKKIIATHYKALLLDLKEGKIAGGENYVRKTEAVKPGEGAVAQAQPAAATPPVAPAQPAAAAPAATPPVATPQAAPTQAPKPVEPVQPVQPAATPPAATPPAATQPAATPPVAEPAAPSINGILKMPPSIPGSPPVATPPAATPPVAAPTPQPVQATPPVATPPVQQAPVVEREAPVEILDIEDIILEGPGSSAVGSAPVPSSTDNEQIDDIVSGSTAQEAARSSVTGKKKKTIDEIILEHLSLDD